MKSRRSQTPKRKIPLKPMTPGQIQKMNPSTQSTTPSKSLSELMAEMKSKKENGKDIIIPLSKNSTIVDIIEKKQNENKENLDPKILLEKELKEMVKSKGDKGDKGDQGERGEKGEKGEEGKQGIPGTKGLPGSAGPRGLQGVPGLPGKQGIPGSRGALGGSTGPQGPPGPPGPPGPSGPSGPQGSVGKCTCKKTSSDVPGAVGPKGQPGIAGPKGKDGKNGEDGKGGVDGKDGLVGLAGKDGAPGKDALGLTDITSSTYLGSGKWEIVTSDGFVGTLSARKKATKN